MPRENRKEIIAQLEEMRGSQIITYLTSTRPGLDVQMAMDVVPVLYEHLMALPGTKEKRKIDLFLHSNGGEGVVPWRLVTLIREFCDEFTLLVPNHAFSAGTLMALGADTVIMHPMGMLGPTDPTVTNPYNPVNERNTSELLGISVEDVSSYIALVKEDVGIHHEDELIHAFKALTDRVHPLALGNVKRSTSQSRMMGEKLLKRRKKNPLGAHEVDEIIKKLTSELYFHGHPINRDEARDDLGLSFVEDAETDVEQAMWELLDSYSTDMRLRDEFLPIQEAVLIAGTSLVPPAPGDNPVSQHVPLPTMEVVHVESTARSDVLEMTYEVTMRRDWMGSLDALFMLVAKAWRTE